MATSRWEIAWEDLMLSGKILGKGNFGEVQLGRVFVANKWVKAAIKTLKSRYIIPSIHPSMCVYARQPNLYTDHVNKNSNAKVSRAR